MIVKCKECGTSLEVDESLYEKGASYTTICSLCGTKVSFTVSKEAVQENVYSASKPMGIWEYCPKCGTQHPRDAIFCSECGFRFISSDNSNTAPVLPPKEVDGKVEDAHAVQTQVYSHLNILSTPKTSPRIISGIAILLLLMVIMGGLLLYFIFRPSSSETYSESKVQAVESSTLSKEKEKTSEQTKQYQSSGNPIEGRHQGEGYTDLGLSVLWSNYNVGASDAMDYGNLYGWGNTQTGLSTDLNQYPCANPPYSIKGTGYDVAQALWGGNWRMPTLSELRELKDYCSWTKVEYSQGTFYKVTGPNGNSILLPLSGYKKGYEYKSVGEWGFIWSSELYDGNNQFAANLSFGGKNGIVETSGYYRYAGESIRPVIDKK